MQLMDYVKEHRPNFCVFYAFMNLGANILVQIRLWVYLRKNSLVWYLIGELEVWYAVFWLHFLSFWLTWKRFYSVARLVLSALVSWVLWKGSRALHSTDRVWSRADRVSCSVMGAARCDWKIVNNGLLSNLRSSKVSSFSTFTWICPDNCWDQIISVIKALWDLFSLLLALGHNPLSCVQELLESLPILMDLSHIKETSNILFFLQNLLSNLRLNCPKWLWLCLVLVHFEFLDF